jgi:cation/acetate symporter
LIGRSHWEGVVVVGLIVVVIVVTAGMVSTTWVQFIKGSLLVVFCFILTCMILHRGINLEPQADIEAPGEAVMQLSIKTGPTGPIQFLREIDNVILARRASSNRVEIKRVHDLLHAGGSPTFKGVRSPKLFDKLDFISLMLALFAGTASLPHILIRYYTVKDAASARKSTVVGIASIGFFYILTLYIGLGAMVSGNLDPTDSNMAAPLLARSFGELPFAVISAIAFTTVLGTVSGLIMAASGAVAHDIMTNFMQMKLDDHQKVRAGKIVAVVVGAVAMGLGMAFKGMNVSFLVGWAFNVAASANLPALIMLLFWRGTTKQGITIAIVVGMLASLAWILLSPQCFKDVYGIDPAKSIIPFSQPGLVTIPLGFVVLVAVSIATASGQRARGFEVVKS